MKRVKEKLHPEWPRLLRHAWSVRLIILAAFLSGIEVALPFMFDSLPVPAGAFAAISGVVTAAALVARIMI